MVFGSIDRSVIGVAYSSVCMWISHNNSNSRVPMWPVILHEVTGCSSCVASTGGTCLSQASLILCEKVLPSHFLLISHKANGWIWVEHCSPDVFIQIGNTQNPTHRSLWTLNKHNTIYRKLLELNKLSVSTEVNLCFCGSKVKSTMGPRVIYLGCAVIWNDLTLHHLTSSCVFSFRFLIGQSVWQSRHSHSWCGEWAGLRRGPGHECKQRACAELSGQGDCLWSTGRWGKPQGHCSWRCCPETMNEWIILMFEFQSDKVLYIEISLDLQCYR